MRRGVTMGRTVAAADLAAGAAEPQMHPFAADIEARLAPERAPVTMRIIDMCLQIVMLLSERRVRLDFMPAE